MRPVIGMTLDHEQPGGYSKFPWFALRENYASAVVQAGGIPWPLASLPGAGHSLSEEDYLERLDGLLITGGAFDIDPSYYGATKQRDDLIIKDTRTAFEMAVLRGALRRNMPVLGICGGQQLLHVAMGGTLIQHLPDSFPDGVPHEQPNPRDEPGHPVQVIEGTQLFAILGETEIMVNSAHHQAAADVPTGVTLNALAPDGVIEGIEVGGQPFCIGVQWHPEFHISTADQRLFAAFIEASSAYGRRRD